MGLWDGSGISWTTCKQSAPRSRLTTTPTSHHAVNYGSNAESISLPPFAQKKPRVLSKSNSQNPTVTRADRSYFTTQNTAVLVAYPAPLKLQPYGTIKVAHTRLPSVGSWSRFLAVSLQVTWLKPGSRLPLLSARPEVTSTTLKRAATNFAAWWTEAQWVWPVWLRLLPDSVVTAIWTRAILRLSAAC